MINDLTPSQIVSELNKYIIGQDNAKKAVAIALRNRIRRQKLPPELIDEVTPKNIRLRKKYLTETDRIRSKRRGE